MTDQKKIRHIADEECVLDAAGIVVGEDYIDRTPFEHLYNPAIVAELKRAGFTHAQARKDRYSFKPTTFRLD